jgi:hypothetical protein
MSADFSRVAVHLADNLRRHAERDYPGNSGMAKIRRAVFIDRGGHAPGELCPSAFSHQEDDDD